VGELIERVIKNSKSDKTPDNSSSKVKEESFMKTIEKMDSSIDGVVKKTTIFFNWLIIGTFLLTLSSS